MSHMKQAEEALYQSYEALTKHIGSVKADQWIKPILVLEANDNGVVTLGIKKGLAFKWVISNYSNILKEYMIKFMPACTDVKFKPIDENHTSKRYKSKNSPDTIIESTQTIQAEDVPRNTIPRNTIPRNTIPRNTIPRKNAPKQNALKKNVPKQKLPKQNIPSFKSQAPQSSVDGKEGDDKLFDQGDFTLNYRYQFENFVVGEPNKLAYSLAEKTAQYDEPNPTLNPLFFYGGVGLGKTHLMTAIAHKYRQNFPHKNVLYISAETFSYKFIQAIKKNTNYSNYDFKKELREIDMLLMDDIQFLVGKPTTEKEFLQVFKALDDQGKQIILSADSPPSDIKGMDDRIISRINQGMVGNIQSTDYNLRLRIIKDKSKRLTNIKIPLDVMEFLADKITNNIRELEGALKRIIQSAELVGQPINIDTTKDSLADILRSNSQSTTVKDIKKTVATYYDVKESDLDGKSRVQNIAMARHVAVYLSKNLTEKSQAAIGREFNRDHTTVINSIRKIKKEIEKNTAIKEDIRILEGILK